MNKKIFADSIKKLSESMEEATHWHNSKMSIGSLSSDQDNYLYEFFCYIHLVADLSEHYLIRYVPDRMGKHKFPRKAGSKQNYPRFDAYSKRQSNRRMFQICAGTLISADDGHQIAPDISFQKPNSGEKPCAVDLILCMDAKFKRDPNDRLPQDEVFAFCETVNHVLGLSGIRGHKINFFRFKELTTNSILTNGKPHNDGAGAYLKQRKVKEVYSFDTALEYRVLG